MLILTDFFMANNLRDKDQILNHFKGRNVETEYLEDHIVRYIFLLQTVDNLIKSSKKPIKILDIGPSFQTEILRFSLPSTTRVDSLGFNDLRFKKRPTDKHIQFNLNNAQDPKKWIKLSGYDIIIMAELIEHLYTSPRLVLDLVKTFLNKGGKLIIQTPNAVSLNRRLKMILGRNPYDMIRETNLNPGHFREYTPEELVNISKDLGFKTKQIILSNYFKHRGFSGKLYNFICQYLPNNFKDGITLVLEK